jgi:RNA-directed DNA polymerase
MTRAHPDLPWCRYADDGLVHCRSELEAETLKVELQARLAECGLEMHPTKTKIVYCKDGKRQGRYPNVTFDLLGYQFRPRVVRSSRNNELFCSFTPAVSPAALKAIRSTVRDLNIRQLTLRSLDDIAKKLNPLLRGWIGYYGRYNPSALETMVRHVNLTLVGWTMRKFKRFHGRKAPGTGTDDSLVLSGLAARSPPLSHSRRNPSQSAPISRHPRKADPVLPWREA